MVAMLPACHSVDAKTLDHFEDCLTMHISSPNYSELNFYRFDFQMPIHSHKMVFWYFDP